jgi:hypothetical protein
MVVEFPSIGAPNGTATSGDGSVRSLRPFPRSIPTRDAFAYPTPENVQFRRGVINRPYWAAMETIAVHK